MNCRRFALQYLILLFLITCAAEHKAGSSYGGLGGFHFGFVGGKSYREID